MQDVELIEVGPGAPGAESAGGADGAVDGVRATGTATTVHAHGGWSPRRRPRWWIGGTATALVLALAVPAVVQARRESARLDRLSGVPGILAPVDGPLTVLWTADSFWIDLAVVGDTAIGTRWPATGAEVRGLDAQTGATIWTVPLDPAGTGAFGDQCVVPTGPGGQAPEPSVVCLVVDSSEKVTEDGTETEGDVSYNLATAAHLLVLDPATGETLAERFAEPQTTLAALDGDVLVSAVADGVAHISRVAPRSGDVRWSVTQQGIVADATAEGVALPSSCYAAPTGDLVLVRCGGRSWVLSTDGELVTDSRDQERGGLLVTTGGRTLQYRSEEAGDAYEIADLHSGAALSFSSLTSPMTTTDDGSAPRLFLAGGSTLEGWDLDSGDRLWSSKAPASMTAVLGGTVYSAGTGGVRALGALSGHERWHADVGDSGITSMVTDGRVLVVAVETVDAQGSGESTLTALDLSDGRKEWTATLDMSVSYLSVVSGHLFAMSRDGVTAALG